MFSSTQTLVWTSFEELVDILGVLSGDLSQRVRGLVVCPVLFSRHDSRRAAPWEGSHGECGGPIHLRDCGIVQIVLRRCTLSLSKTF